MSTQTRYLNAPSPLSVFISRLPSQQPPLNFVLRYEIMSRPTNFIRHPAPKPTSHHDQRSLPLHIQSQQPCLPGDAHALFGSITFGANTDSETLPYRLNPQITLNNDGVKCENVERSSNQVRTYNLWGNGTLHELWSDQRNGTLHEPWSDQGNGTLHEPWPDQFYSQQCEVSCQRGSE